MQTKEYLAPGSTVDKWVARFAKGPLSAEEARQFNTWLTAHPQHEDEFDHGREAWLRMDYIRNDPRFEQWERPSVYERVANAIYETRCALKKLCTININALLIGTAAAAAVVVVLFINTLGVAPSTTPIPSPADYITDVAEIREEVLPDGSIVTLGARSAINIQFTDAERRVALITGQAFFDVQDNSERPFIVVAAETLVRVLGTKFDVSLGSALVNVAVSEGQVEVIQLENINAPITDRDIKHVLTAGQRVSATQTGRVRPVETIDADKIAAWRRSQLIWINTPIRDIIDDLNRYSEDRIILDDDALGELEYTFVSQAGDISKAVTIIADSLGVEVVRHESGDVVLR